MTSQQQVAFDAAESGMSDVLRWPSAVQPATARTPRWRQSGLAPTAAHRGEIRRSPICGSVPQRPDPDAEARLVVLFEDAISFDPVLNVYHLISAQLRPACVLAESWWNFEALAVARLQPYAIRDAARADIILLAARDTVSPPRMIRDWVDGWAARRTGTDGILIALLTGVETEAPRPTPLEQYLGASARAAHLDFLADTYSPRPETDAWPVANESPKATKISTCAAVSRTLPASARVRHWGNND